MPKPNDPERQKYMFTDDIKFLQKALVFHPEKSGMFLALKRPPDAFSRPNDWDLPGGNVRFGELHEASLRQEIAEETGLEVGKFKTVQAVTNFDKEKSLYYIFIGSSCQAISDVVRLSPEHTQYRWVTKDEFAELQPAQYLVDLANAA